MYSHPFSLCSEKMEDEDAAVCHGNEVLTTAIVHHSFCEGKQPPLILRVPTGHGGLVVMHALSCTQVMRIFAHTSTDECTHIHMQTHACMADLHKIRVDVHTYTHTHTY